MRIDLTHVFREDFKYFINLYEKEQECTRKMIQRFEVDLIEVEHPSPRAYVPEVKKKLTPVEIIMRGYAIIKP